MKIGAYELKPCPFCGSDDLCNDLIIWSKIRCMDCLSSSYDYQTFEKAIEAWNKRI
jgi:Lar family restriction alleviation protein